MTTLVNALRKAREDPAVKVIVIRGEGKAFCSGADLGNLDQMRKSVITMRRHLRHYADVLLELTNAGTVTLPEGWAGTEKLLGNYTETAAALRRRSIDQYRST